MKKASLEFNLKTLAQIILFDEQAFVKIIELSKSAAKKAA